MEPLQKCKQHHTWGRAVSMKTSCLQPNDRHDDIQLDIAWLRAVLPFCLPCDVLMVFCTSEPPSLAFLPCDWCSCLRLHSETEEEKHERHSDGSELPLQILMQSHCHHAGPISDASFKQKIKLLLCFCMLFGERTTEVKSFTLPPFVLSILDFFPTTKRDLGLVWWEMCSLHWNHSSKCLVAAVMSIDY